MNLKEKIYRVSYAGVLLGITKSTQKDIKRKAYDMTIQHTINPNDILYHQTIERDKINFVEKEK
jgi:hypothetical protein